MFWKKIERRDNQARKIALLSIANFFGLHINFNFSHVYVIYINLPNQQAYVFQKLKGIFVISGWTGVPVWEFTMGNREFIMGGNATSLKMNQIKGGHFQEFQMVSYPALLALRHLNRVREGGRVEQSQNLNSYDSYV